MIPTPRFPFTALAGAALLAVLAGCASPGPQATPASRIAPAAAGLAEQATTTAFPDRALPKLALLSLPPTPTFNTPKPKRSHRDHANKPS